MHVTNETELLNALTSHIENIVIDNSFSLTREILIDYSVTISSSTNITLNRCLNNMATFFNITEDGNLKLTNITLDGTSEDDVDSPLIINNNNLTLHNVTISNAVSSTSGAGLYCSEKASYAYIINSNFTNCISRKNGGAIYCCLSNNENEITLSTCKFSQNKAVFGGAIYLNNKCTLTIYNGDFNNNQSSIAGNDIYNAGKIYIRGTNNISAGLYLDSRDNILNLINTIANSNILIEESNYVTPVIANSPITLAIGIDEYPTLTSEDLVSFHKPIDNFSNWDLKQENEATISLVARVQPTSYTITYTNLNGATNPNPVTYLESDLPLTLQEPTLDGSEFLGWLDENNDLITQIDSSHMGNRTLKATWNLAITYEVSFEKNSTDSVTNLPATIVVSPGNSLTLPDNIPQRRGYLFLNWNTLANNTGTTYYPKETIIDIQSDLVLYAIWYKLTPQFICCPANYYCICCKCQKKIKDICCPKSKQCCSCKKHF